MKYKQLVAVDDNGWTDWQLPQRDYKSLAAIVAWSMTWSTGSYL